MKLNRWHFARNQVSISLSYLKHKQPLDSFICLVTATRFSLFGLKSRETRIESWQMDKIHKRIDEAFAKDDS